MGMRSTAAVALVLVAATTEAKAKEEKSNEKVEIWIIELNTSYYHVNFENCFKGGDMVVDGGPWAWGLCYNHEMSPNQIYCADNLKYPCVEGVEYYGRGAIPVYWNYNYGRIGKGLKVDLLHHPEYLKQNATLPFMAAMWQWMTPVKNKQPSAHDVFVSNWKPTKNDTAEHRLPGFGAIMNILYGDLVCGQAYINSMNNIISTSTTSMTWESGGSTLVTTWIVLSRRLSAHQHLPPPLLLRLFLDERCVHQFVR